jgi:hypothetical protein
VIWYLLRGRRRRRLRRGCRTGVRWRRRWLISLAESELGRPALRGELEPMLATAGADYARHWRGYIASLSIPNSMRLSARGNRGCGRMCLARPDTRIGTASCAAGCRSITSLSLVAGYARPRRRCARPSAPERRRMSILLDEDSQKNPSNVRHSICG